MNKKHSKIAIFKKNQENPDQPTTEGKTLVSISGFSKKETKISIIMVPK